jgi:two-component system, NarL family, invasion response regulator UvrY
MNQYPHQTEKETLNILLADDHTIVRLALKTLVRNMYSEANVEEAENGESITRKLKSASFDLLVLDINMPNTEPFSLATYLLKEFPALKILIFTINQELLFAKRFLKLGVHGYMIKESREPEIRIALQKILDGENYISEWLADAISNDLINPEKGNPFEALSEREFEVALQILKGYTVNEIAGILHVNASTIGTHKSRLLHKLGLSNKIELLNLAREFHII